MGKNENISFFVPDAPLGFPLLNNSKTASSPAVEEIRSCHMHEQNHNSSSSREQPNVNTVNVRRTTRKLTPPKPLYVPPTAPVVPTRLRGRPRKARSVVSQYSSYHQEGQETNSKRKRIDSCVHKRPANTTHSSFSWDLGVEQTNSPTSGYCRMEDPCLSNQPGHNIDSTNLHQVGQNHPTLVDASTKLRSSEPDENLAKILNDIKDKYGDITRNCLLESDYMKAFVSLGICKVVHDLQNKHLTDVDVNTLDSCYKAVRDAEKLNVNVQWLHKRLEEVEDAIKSSDEAKAAVSERNKCMENIIVKNKELEHKQVELKRLESEIHDLEDQVAREAVMVEECKSGIELLLSKNQFFLDFSSTLP